MSRRTHFMRQLKACFAMQLLTNPVSVWTPDSECPGGCSLAPCGPIRVLHEQGRCTFCNFRFGCLGSGADYGFSGRTHCAPQKYGDGVERDIRSHNRFSLCHQRLICGCIPGGVSMDTAYLDCRGFLAVHHRFLLDSPPEEAP